MYDFHCALHMKTWFRGGVKVPPEAWKWLLSSSKKLILYCNLQWYIILCRTKIISRRCPVSGRCFWFVEKWYITVYYNTKSAFRRKLEATFTPQAELSRLLEITFSFVKRNTNQGFGPVGNIACLGQVLVASDGFETCSGRLCDLLEPNWSDTGGSWEVSSEQVSEQSKRYIMLFRTFGFPWFYFMFRDMFNNAITYTTKSF